MVTNFPSGIIEKLGLGVLFLYFVSFGLCNNVNCVISRRLLGECVQRVYILLCFNFARSFTFILSPCCFLVLLVLSPSSKTVPFTLCTLRSSCTTVGISRTMLCGESGASGNII